MDKCTSVGRAAGGSAARRHAPLIGTAMQGDPPEQVQQYLTKVKWSSIVVLVGIIGSFATGRLPLNEMFYLIACIFLLNEGTGETTLIYCLVLPTW